MDNHTPPKRKVTSGKAANHDNAPANEITLLDKHLAVMFASTDKRLSAGDIAVLFQIMDYFNLRKGYAYPNMDTLAFNTNRTKRTIVDSVDRLENLGYLKIVRHGCRTTSNRYLPIFHVYVRPTKPDSELDTVQSASPYMVQSTAAIGEVQRNELVQSTSPETTYEPAYQAGDIGGGVANAPPAAALPSPLASQLAAKNQNASGLRYPEFWAAYPKRQNVSAANSEIAAALARGVSMATMVEAARQYAVWIAAQPWENKDKYTKGAANFIKKECWLEDYTVKQKEVKPKAAETLTKEEEGRGLISKLEAALVKSEERITDHAKSCEKCRDHMEQYDDDCFYELNANSLCKVGAQFLKQRFDDFDRLDEASQHQEETFGDSCRAFSPP